MKLQSIVVIFIDILLLLYGKFVRGIYISLEKLGSDIHGGKAVTKMGFLFIFVSPNVWTVFLGQYLVPCTQF